MIIRIFGNEHKLKNLQKSKKLNGKKEEIHAETYSKIAFTTNSTLAKIVLVLKKKKENFLVAIFHF